MYWFVYELCKDYTYLDIIMSLPYVVSLLMHRGSQVVTLWAAESQMKLAEVMAARQMVLDLGHVIPNDKWEWHRESPWIPEVLSRSACMCSFGYSCT